MQSRAPKDTTQQACRLCGSNDPLSNSHIIPDFFIKSTQRRQTVGSSGPSQLFMHLISTRPGAEDGVRQRGYWEKAVGLKEKLLCAKCEAGFSNFESYARILLYGSTPTPLKKLSIGTSMRASVPNAAWIFAALSPQYPEADIRVLTGLDYHKLRLFQLSLLWRICVARGNFFDRVTSDTKHEPIIRKMLLSNDPGNPNDYCCAMFDLRSDGSGCEGYIIPPHPFGDQDGPMQGYRMILGGFAFDFYGFGRSPAPEMLRCCVHPSGEAMIGVVDAKPYLTKIAEKCRLAGKL